MTRTDSTTALDMSDVGKVYPMGDEEIIALDGVDLEVAAGQPVALVGPSGSGKTTLCSITGGLLTPTSGSVVVAGEDTTDYKGRQLTRLRQRRIGFVFQTVNLVPFLTARENLLIVNEPTSALDSALGEQVMELIHRDDRISRTIGFPGIHRVYAAAGPMASMSLPTASGRSWPSLSTPGGA